MLSVLKKDKRRWKRVRKALD
ncbi:hypothetical protein TSAR_005933 [Trichomalopsis sarcophagae]|uniref:Uncharacterized protein n=1 Tax=Trichomalopsis sarcophagae TaxID=543379 RepID=A0A232FCT2_9HYME|nr:hypothetical protein TSAR_005933 [Trichomalopsis sarcophagae]